MDSDDEDSGETELNSSSGSDKDFKLNLNDDEEEEENEDDESAVDKDSDDHVRVNKKEKKSTSSKSKHKNLMKRAPSSNEITQTNSIPSNQLTKNSQAFNKNFELFMSQESSLLSSNQKRRESLEELNNVSFSIKFEETCGTQNNTNNMSDPNVLEDDENTSKGVEEPEEDELGVFDELAMLCSVQFRKGLNFILTICDLNFNLKWTFRCEKSQSQGSKRLLQLYGLGRNERDHRKACTS